jgi:diaminohydroxyphosphoribosylaminopyrimidine deaminase/5-amino-6-(5-phosphoribosylamino)uracil reductase
MAEVRYMERCLDLAAMAWPSCRPNPMVGAVLVKDEKILGEGYTQAFGSAHAEVMALRNVQEKDLSQATLYVSLEPCAHHGKTPPCVDLIMEKGIGKVIIATRDPFPEVDGKGIEILREKGVTVEVGLMEKEARFQNRRFFTFHEKKRPYVILKWARTKDDFIDSAQEQHASLKISSALSSQYVHRWRAEEMAILVGGETYRKDKPSLDTRLANGPNPRPIIWSKTLKEKDLQEKHLGRASIISADSVEGLLAELYDAGIQSLLVEGGAKVLQAFLKSGHYDEVRRITAEMEIGQGIQGPSWLDVNSTRYHVGADILDWEIRS